MWGGLHRVNHSAKVPVFEARSAYLIILLTLSFPSALPYFVYTTLSESHPSVISIEPLLIQRSFNPPNLCQQKSRAEFNAIINYERSCSPAFVIESQSKKASGRSTHQWVSEFVTQYWVLIYYISSDI
jgi:hypothetical protein